MTNKLWAALNTLSKAGWDASWGANNGEEVEAAYNLLSHFLTVMDEHGCIEANADELEAE